MCETTNQLFLPISCGYRTWLFSLRKMYQADLNIHTGSFMASTPNYIVFTASMSHWETFHLQQQKHILQNRFLMVSLNIRVYTSHVMAILMVKKMKKNHPIRGSTISRSRHWKVPHGSCHSMLFSIGSR